MGGFQTLEWPLCTPPGYVQSIIPITTSAYQGAWGISWGETQRQAIFSDHKFESGWYSPVPEGQPRKGLGTARMVAMLTYRSQFSFEARFSRKPATTARKSPPPSSLPTPPASDSEDVSEKRTEHSKSFEFAAQSYLRYQADKFLHRFDANCYIHLTKKMDTHDVTHGRIPSSNDVCHPPTESQLQQVLKNVPANALVVSVETDVLFRPEQQRELARCLPQARFVALESEDGHDGFLLEFESLNEIVRDYLRERAPRMYEGSSHSDFKGFDEVGVMNSVFGEAEPDPF